MLKGLTPIPFKLVSVASGAARFDLVAFTLASLVFARDRERAVCADDIGNLPRREEPQHEPTGTPANYTVPNHSHTSDELYVWLRGAFTYVAADGQQVEIDGPAYISLPGNTPHALKCHSEPCVFYVRYGRPFDLHLHAMPK